MHRTFLIIGGNLGDRELNLAQTISRIELKVGRIVKKSDIFESEPWGFEHQTPFLNQVLEVETSLSALCLLDACQLIESDLGRNRFSEGYEARTVDIDILFFDDRIYTLPPIIVPHKLLQDRMFVLEPLSQIAPDLVHPILGLSVTQLKLKCTDKSSVVKYVQVKERINA